MNFQIGKIQTPPKGLNAINTPDSTGGFNKKIIAEGSKPTVKKASTPKKSRLFDNLSKIAKTWEEAEREHKETFEDTLPGIYEFKDLKKHKFKIIGEGDGFGNETVRKNNKYYDWDHESRTLTPYKINPFKKKASFMGNFVKKTAKKSMFPMAITGGVTYLSAKNLGSKTPLSDAAGVASKNVTLPITHHGLNIGEVNEKVFKRDDERKKNLQKSLFSDKLIGVSKNEIPGT